MSNPFNLLIRSYHGRTSASPPGILGSSRWWCPVIGPGTGHYQRRGLKQSVAQSDRKPGMLMANTQWCNLKLDILVFATIIRKNFRKIIVT